MATAPSAVSSESEIILRDDNVTPLSEELTKLYSQGFLTDITLSTEDGKNFEAHRILLAARSHYFHSVVPRLKSEPVIFLKGVKGTILDKILKYIYGGSVVVSKHQVRPLLEVAKSLQVKGLQDLVPGQLNSKAAAQQHRFGRLSLPSAVVDKTTLTTFKPPSSIPRRSAPGGANHSARYSSVLQQNGNTSDDTEEKDPAKDESDAEGESAPKPKRKRGRPPKHPKVEDEKKQRGKDASADPYDFEEEESSSADRKDKSWRAKKKKKGGDQEEGSKGEDEGKDDETEDNENGGVKKESIKGASKSGSSIHGKQIIPVKCKGQLAELHISRFASGVRGLSIRYKDTWMTPQNFESACGCTTKYYLENIQTDYGPLKTLTASGMLKPHSRKCRCSLCRGEDPPSPAKEEEEEDESPGPRKGVKKDDSDDEDEDEDEEDDDEDEEDDEDEDEEDEDEEEKRRMKKREEWSRQLEAKLKSEYDDSPPQITPQVTHSHHPLPTAAAAAPQPPPTPQPPTILSSSPLVSSATLVSGAPPSTSYISILDQPPKISPSILPGTATAGNPGGIQLATPAQPERIDTPQTVFVMSSPHPHISAPPTPQHNPFANVSHSFATQISAHQQQQPTVTMALSALPQQHTAPQGLPLNNAGAANSNTSPNQQQQLQSQQRPAQSRIGSVMQVRCKSTTALLYANGYESGSRGKCIQLGDEWLTPNEFEDRAGSKAKKYLSSIKCLGRPLRVYVNSGELRGTGNAQQAKLLKDKLKTPQPIAPAPPTGTLGGQNGIQAPPTPSHVSGSLPPNLNMMMAPGGQPPILINQTSMASSLMGSPSIITGPMTVALGSPPFEVRHSQAM